jgi:lysophospholipase L1-like esterase
VHESNNLDSQQQKRIDYHYARLSLDALVETFDRLDRIVRKVATEKGAILIDASAHLSGKEWAFDDHVHVMPKGSEALAQFVADHLQPILKSP